jgi:hypothetical protein
MSTEIVINGANGNNCLQNCKLFQIELSVHEIVMDDTIMVQMEITVN